VLSIQASRSPNDESDVRRFACGPLSVEIDSSVPEAFEALCAALELYRHDTETADAAKLEVRHATVNAVAAGTYLTCGRMLVDRDGDRIFASTQSGITVTRRSLEATWHVAIPTVSYDEPTIGDLEDVLSLVFTEHWRTAGLQPLHAGCAVSPRGTSAMLCAASGGGKSTLTVALIRDGWKTLGDDKLLVARGSGIARSLTHSFNIHPRATDWFEELAHIHELPRYSAWTEKRRVVIEDVWPGTSVAQATPQYVVRVVRDDSVGKWSLRSLTAAQLLATILDQVVIPNDRVVARAIMEAVTEIAGRTCGIELRLGSQAYERRGIAAALDAALG
jgi:hypothetical protein